MQPLVLDTNVVLDLLVFRDDAAAPLMHGLQQGQFAWLATDAMRDELQRVLGYPKLAARVAHHGREPQAVLEDFDQHVRIVEAPTRATVTCADPDDQKFIDLAVAHRTVLLSKDAAVLTLRKRLAALQVKAAPALAALA